MPEEVEHSYWRIPGKEIWHVAVRMMPDGRVQTACGLWIDGAEEAEDSYVKQCSRCYDRLDRIRPE